MSIPDYLDFLNKWSLGLVCHADIATGILGDGISTIYPTGNALLCPDTTSHFCILTNFGVIIAKPDYVDFYINGHGASV